MQRSIQHRMRHSCSRLSIPSTANVCLSTVRVAKTFTVLHTATVLDTTAYSVFVKESSSVFSDAFFRAVICEAFIETTIKTCLTGYFPIQ